MGLSFDRGQVTTPEETFRMHEFPTFPPGLPVLFQGLPALVVRPDAVFLLDRLCYLEAPPDEPNLQEPLAQLWLLDELTQRGASTSPASGKYRLLFLHDAWKRLKTGQPFLRRVVHPWRQTRDGYCADAPGYEPVQLVQGTRHRSDETEQGYHLYRSEGIKDAFFTGSEAAILEAADRWLLALGAGLIRNNQLLSLE